MTPTARDSAPPSRAEAAAPGRRSFVAVPLPAEIRVALVTTMNSLAQETAGVKWSANPDNLHITVKFLGKVTDNRLALLAAALSRGLGAVPAFAVGVTGIGAFPGARHAGVVWAGIDEPTGALARIAAAVEKACADLGLAEPEPRPFRAHVTLGRARPPVDVRAVVSAWSQRAFGSFTVDQVHLYESQLSPRGAIHTLRSRALLTTTG